MICSICTFKFTQLVTIHMNWRRAFMMKIMNGAPFQAFCLLAHAFASIGKQCPVNLTGSRRKRCKKLVKSFCTEHAFCEQQNGAPFMVFHHKRVSCKTTFLCPVNLAGSRGCCSQNACSRGAKSPRDFCARCAQSARTIEGFD